MSTQLFEEARNRINASLIESMLSAPGAYWQNGQYITLNPLRSDKSVGSFSISGAGLWYDHATKEGGDLIDIVIGIQGLSGASAKPKAAEWIIKAQGGTVENFQPEENKRAAERRTKPKKEKEPCVAPIPPEGIAAIKRLAGSTWARERYGKPVRAWRYETAEGPAFLKVRYHDCPSGRDKEFCPFYWDGKRARVGIPTEFDRNRPMLGLKNVLAYPEAKILGVEGEKKYDAASKQFLVPDWVVVAFDPSGGGVSKTDWSPLKDRDFTYWPDHDLQIDNKGELLPPEKQPGMAYALVIRSKLPQTKVLAISDKPDGWDAADAQAQGINLVDFVANCPLVGDIPTPPPEPPVQGNDEPPPIPEPPFVALGYDTEHYYFLKKSTRSVFTIAKGNFNGSRLLEIANLGWWRTVRRGALLTDGGNIRVTLAQDLVQHLSEEAGRFDLATLRGAGVWRDGESQIVVNDGRQIVGQDGKKSAFDAWKSEFHYVASDSRFPGLSGDGASDTDGRQLMALIQAQGWANRLQAVCVLGWCLIAPFGGILRWRPHLWITGARGTGKSYVLENIVDQLLGDFRHTGSGKDTAAAIYRSLNQDAKPVRLDEMEPEVSTDAANIHNILTVARNSSSDVSARRTISDGNGIKTFITRSCFCFASIAIPENLGGAIASRIVTADLLVAADQRAKIAETKRHIGCMSAPDKFRRRTFRALPQILADIEYLRSELLGVVGDQRQVDQLAPLLASAWSALSADPISCDGGKAFVAELTAEAAKVQTGTVADETRVLHHILSVRIPLFDGGVKPIAELLATADSGQGGANDAADALSRVGIRFKEIGGQRFLAIATKSDAIKAALKDTVYAAGYDQQVKRHKLCSTPNEAAQIRFKIGSVRARLFNWSEFKAAYVGSENDQGDLM